MSTLLIIYHSNLVVHVLVEWFVTRSGSIAGMVRSGQTPPPARAAHILVSLVYVHPS
jgi:hypothetical protein